ncbi:hypothetical protein J7547_06315 [Wohlfahrtiimonas chitiniclastica]|uniref:Glycosyltransferase RgtA/B/C/D-like domain-containing protein n=1 Tax=Wohlfahrtiimonas chitiniclastica TaxID=400946 RepID=A0AB35BZ09_9GAMM|nr:DUF6056 family protein [Wohlfahrtiimonas chitiniclastica]MBS7824731.1 hypothetical protein [Wohlfahrtiimonas chitiniclastica]MBS7840435.1 hypothetical protein [Wohlfahrtiimonas chitiniclastica]
MMTKAWPRYLSYAVAFSLVFYIAYLTPIHSDDFSYYNMGLQWSAHVSHYLSWSGRLVSDYISSILLHLENDVLRSGILALAVVSMVALLAKLPALVLKQHTSCHVFIILFMIYWINSPAIGQTVFWTVGAANYLFTNLAIVIYLYCLIKYMQSSQSILWWVGILIISPFAAFSNENTTWIVLLFSIVSTYYLMRYQQDRKIWLSSFIIVLGFCFFILSPGNAARAASGAFDDFYSMSFLERSFGFFLYRYPRGIAAMLPIIIIGSIFLKVAQKNHLSFIYSKIIYVLVIISFTSMLSMIMSPMLSARSTSGPILFLLLAISVLLHYLTHIVITCWKSVYRVTVCIIFIIFVMSYVMIAHSYQRLSAQNKILNNAIEIAHANEIKAPTLPEFYYVPSLRKRDSYDAYYNSVAMATYYGFEHIDLKPMAFDYSIMMEHLPHQARDNDLGIQGIYLAPEGIFGQKTTIVLAMMAQQQTNDVLELIITNRSGKTVTLSLPMDAVPIHGQWIMGGVVKMKMQEIVRIEGMLRSSNSVATQPVTIYGE